MYLISNTHLNASAVPGIVGQDEWTWILFVEAAVIESGFDITDTALVEIYKYIDGERGTNTKSRVVNVEEARAEWRFWIGQGFQRVTDKTNKGWKYTRDIRQRCGIEKMIGVKKTSNIIKEMGEKSDAQ